MRGTKWIVLTLALSMVVCLAGCGEELPSVYVQNVGKLMNQGAIVPGDYFQGIVVSEDITQIEKDNKMAIAELLVKAGDDVKEGQALFSYDTQQLQLSLDKQKLEREQLAASIENYELQIAELEKERKAASSKLEYTIQIQSTQLDLKEAQINLRAKEDEVKQAEEMLKNATVVSPVAGRVQAVSENGTDNYGNPKPYITIQKAGAYRVKGTIGELQRGAVMEGTAMRVLSRTDANQSWTGTVTLVDYKNPSQGNENDMHNGMSSDEMSSSSKYPFYLELEDTDGLLLGQHVYLELDIGDVKLPELTLSSAFICYEEDGGSYVWAEDKGSLQKRPITLGTYVMETDSYEVLSGLTKEDYIAFPDMELCVEGAPVTRTQQTDESEVA